MRWNDLRGFAGQDPIEIANSTLLARALTFGIAQLIILINQNRPSLNHFTSQWKRKRYV